MSFKDAQYIIDTAIGAANATGGSTSAGNVMAKLNNIITNASNASSNASNAASYASNAASYASSASSNASSASTSASNAYSTLTNGTYGLSALNTKITSLTSSVTGGSTPVVKSVQKGTHNGSTSAITISISSVNTSKTFVLFFQSRTDFGGSTKGTLYHPTLSSMTSTSLSVTSSDCYVGNNDSTLAFSWQVIEFY